MQVGDSQVGVEADVLQPIGSAEVGEPFLDWAQGVEDIVVDVDFESEDFSLLELGLQSGVVASGLAFFPAAWGNGYLKGEACSSDTRRPTTLILSPVLLRIDRFGLSVIN